MKTVGIIAEYNPFHKGHAYQIAQIREKAGADYVIVAMSGDFVQRGGPALCDKYTRAQMALANGADLVLELPTLWATASAEYFGSAGVELLGSTGVVDTLCYGMEGAHGDMDSDRIMLKALVDAMQQDPAAYDEEVASFQKQGLPYPIARIAALSSFVTGFDDDTMKEFLAKPNNILAIEYEKALAIWNKETTHPMESFPIYRSGDYHGEDLNQEFASATAIRALLCSDKSQEEKVEVLANVLPSSATDILVQEMQNNHLLSDNAISSMLYYKLLSLQKEGYEAYADCSKALSDKIKKNLADYRDFRSFCDLLKSKDLTYTRISRVLTHILLEIKQEDYDCMERVPYLRVLGFRKEAEPLLSEMKKEAVLPMITKMADAKDLLVNNGMELLEKDIFAADLYRQLVGAADRKNEFTQGLLIL